MEDRRADEEELVAERIDIDAVWLVAVPRPSSADLLRKDIRDGPCGLEHLMVFYE